MKKIEKVLVATNLVDDSEVTFTMARVFQKNIAEEVTILHVLEAGQFAVPDESQEEYYLREQRSESELNKMCQRYGLAGSCKKVVLKGSPFELIPNYVEKEKADLVVLGSHRYRYVDRLLNRSVSRATMSRVNCRVLICPL